MVKTLLNEKQYLFLDGNDPSVRELLTCINTNGLKQVIGKHTIVFKDEAQRIAEIGITAKIITDQFKEVQLPVSGSSALEINNITQQPLTGRRFEYHLYSISWEEFEDNTGYINAYQQLENRLIYGMYPNVINNIVYQHQIHQE